MPEEEPEKLEADNVSITESGPFTVVVMPAWPIETEVAFVVPRLSAAFASIVRAPVEVLQVEGALAVKVIAPPVISMPPVSVSFPEASVTGT